MWTKLGEKLDKKQWRKRIADALRGQRVFIVIGRSRNGSGFSNSTPIQIVEGNQPPELVGRPFLLTTFRRGSFSKTLYTPSTLRVVVGREW
jgi:hypothetical protein